MDEYYRALQADGLNPEEARDWLFQRLERMLIDLEEMGTVPPAALIDLHDRQQNRR